MGSLLRHRRSCNCRLRGRGTATTRCKVQRISAGTFARRRQGSVELLGGRHKKSPSIKVICGCTGCCRGWRSVIDGEAKRLAGPCVSMRVHVRRRACGLWLDRGPLQDGDGVGLLGLRGGLVAGSFQKIRYAGGGRNSVVLDLALLVTWDCG